MIKKPESTEVYDLYQRLSHDLLVNIKFLSQDGLRLPENAVSFGPVIISHPEESTSSSCRISVSAP